MPVDLTQLQQFLESAQHAEGFKADVRKALKKVSGLLVSLQSALDEADALFAPDYVPSKPAHKPRAKRPSELRDRVPADPAAPYGRRKDGTPKGKPGAPKQVAEAVAE